jgi:hypothetical protein
MGARLESKPGRKCHVSEDEPQSHEKSVFLAIAARLAGVPRMQPLNGIEPRT